MATSSYSFVIRTESSVMTGSDGYGCRVILDYLSYSWGVVGFYGCKN
jgi:hypothetical protein